MTHSPDRLVQTSSGRTSYASTSTVATMETLCAAGCGKPAHAVLCTSCVRELTGVLREIATGGVQRERVHIVGGEQTTLIDYTPGLADDLDSLVARLASTASSGPRRKATTRPLPFHAAAADLAHALRNTITTWARVLLDDHPDLPGPRGTSAAAVAGWMSTQPTALAMLPAADELHAEVLAMARHVRALLDPPAQRAFLGPCGAELDDPHRPGAVCACDIYADLGRAETACPRCGARWSVSERREWLLGQVDDQLATVTEITRALPALLGENLADSTVRWWASTGKLAQHAPHPHDLRRRPRYRVGDVITLAAARAAELAQAQSA